MIISTLHFAGKSPLTVSSLVQTTIAGNSDKNRDRGLAFFKLWYLQDPTVTQWAELVAEELLSQLIPSPVVDMPASLGADSDKHNPSTLWDGNRLEEPRPTIENITSDTTQVHLALSGALARSNA